MAMGMEDSELDRIKTCLFENAMQGKWRDVIEMYKNNKKAHQAKITVLGDTALHIAILDGKETEVVKLVDQIGEGLNSRMIKNNMGNTPVTPRPGRVYSTTTVGAYKSSKCHIVVFWRLK